MNKKNKSKNKQNAGRSNSRYKKHFQTQKARKPNPGQKKQPLGGNLLTGTIEVIRSGDAFLTGIHGERDVFIPKRNLGIALPGDKISAQLTKEKKGDKIIGKVVNVISRARHDLVGTLKKSRKTIFVSPLAAAYSTDFIIRDTKGAKLNDRVVIRFTRWQEKGSYPEAEVIEVIGPSDNPSLDTISIIKHYGFSEKFPTKAMREAETASELMDQTGERLDLRNEFIITIDPKRARDFDDAISLEKKKSGERVLGVHIADVSHFIKQGGALDKEARMRGTSVYLPDKVIPMIPEQLSNGICSLRPDEDRLAFSAFITLDKDGSTLKTKFAKTIIRSKKRLTYEEALAMLLKPENSKDKKTTKLVLDLHKLAQQLRKKRFDKFALDLDIPECEIELGQDGMIKGIKPVVNDVSHQLIEECMVAANEAVARELSIKKFQPIYRIHEPPKEIKLEELAVQMNIMGLTPGNLKVPKNLSSFLEAIKDHPLAHHIRVSVLRCMNRAVYSCDNEGHFGLAKRYYLHFTSPIRRYPDLIVHRQLEALLVKGQKPAYSKKQLDSIAIASSDSEQQAAQAERDLVEIKTYRYLEQQLKDKKTRIMDAVVVNITSFGMFVELSDLKIQGLIHVSDISSKYVRHNKNQEILQAGKKTYAVGTKIKVYVSKVDFDNRRIDFALA